uniref:Uncharacterized protein n=1 Tax=Panagrolaimus sp. JU765 TaxID=591449 RepID=A0AC34RN47_9BILA
MKSYFQSLLDENVYHNEDDPRYKCLNDSCHVSQTTKCLVCIHFLLGIGFLIAYFPYSFIGLPIILPLIVASIHAVATESSLTLLPLYFYIIANIFANIVLLFVVFIMAIMDYDRLLTILGYPNLDNIILKILLLSAVKLFLIFSIFVYWWQATIISQCRQYYEDKNEQKDYIHLSVPESFLDSKISESAPIIGGINVPDQVIYTLDEEKTPLESDEETPEKPYEETKNKQHEQ